MHARKKPTQEVSFCFLHQPNLYSSTLPLLVDRTDFLEAGIGREQFIHAKANNQVQHVGWYGNQQHRKLNQDRESSACVNGERLQEVDDTAIERLSTVELKA